jgi:hypothetical protein
MKLRKKHVSVLSIAVFAVLTVMGLGIGAANGQDLKAKYAPILGTYEFDLTSVGVGIMKADFYVENNIFYTKPETASEAAAVIPVEGKEFEFTISDPDEGTYKLAFLKDEKGEYTKCRVINEVAGIDVVGTKVVK